jgi:hypothetical protein
MNRIPKIFLPVGVVVALGLFILAAPRTVQAVAAALVQITNTAANPVVTQTTGAQATNMLHLNCTFNLVYGRNTPCWQITSSGTVNFEGPNIPYTVPSGSNFVITAVDVYPAPNGGGTAACPGVYVASIGNVSSVFNPISFLSLTTSNAPVTTHFTYPPPSGIVIGPNTGVYANGNIFNAATGQLVGNCANSSLDVVDLYGYLTTD